MTRLAWDYPQVTMARLAWDYPQLNNIDSIIVIILISNIVSRSVSV